jgi:hypothetical protein
MQAYGSDRFRLAGERVILYSRLPKGWTPRQNRQGTHAEFPGTTVYWDETYLEVITADALPAGGVRYVLEPWREEHTIRVFQHYDENSEARLQADSQQVLKQRRMGLGARVASMILGHLPTDVQQRIANEFGTSPVTMTLLSLIPPVVFFGIVMYLGVGSIVDMKRSPIPGWLGSLSAFWFVESLFRFILVMTQNRGIPSTGGILVYALLRPRQLAKEASTLVQDVRGGFPQPGVHVSEDVEEHDRFLLRAPLFTLLSVAEQRSLAEWYGYDYRDYAMGPALILLSGSGIGVITSVMTLQKDVRVSAVASLLVAGFLAAEQVWRILAFDRGPAGSVVGPLVRPLVRQYLEPR